MLSIRSYLLSNGYIHPLASHTRMAGIWLKLGTLYDLKALDQREDSVDEDLHPEYDEDDEDEGPEYDEDDDDDEEDEEKQAQRDLVDFRGHAGFELDDHGEFAALKWRKRFAEISAEDGKARKRRKSSSPAMPELLDREVPVRFVPSFSVKAEEEDDGVRIKAARGRGGRGVRGGRESLKRGRVPDSVAESEEAEGEAEEDEEDEGEEAEEDEGDEDEDEEDEEGEGDGEEENEDEDEDEENQEESEEEESSEEQEETTAPVTRGRGGRGRGAAAARGRGRAGRRRGR